MQAPTDRECELFTQGTQMIEELLIRRRSVPELLIRAQFDRVREDGAGDPSYVVVFCTMVQAARDGDFLVQQVLWWEARLLQTLTDLRKIQ